MVTCLRWEIPTSGNIFLKGNLIGHVVKNSRGYERVHGEQGYGKKNELGDTILDFSWAFVLVIVNTCFKKRDEPLITY